MNYKFLKSMFLIVGTAIGAGILALPMTTASSGFGGAIVALILCGGFMINAAYYMLKVRLCFREEVDLSTMVRTMLGNRAKIFTETGYLMLLFSLIAVYIIVGSAWTENLMEALFNTDISPHVSRLIFAGAIAFLLFSGISNLSLVNYFISFVMLIALMFIIFLSAPSIDVENVRSANLDQVPWTFPMILTTFGFASIIPSIVTYMKGDKVQTLKILLGGSLVIFVTYLAWEMIAFGVLGEELMVLAAMGEDQGTEVVGALSDKADAPFFREAGLSFMILATLSSLLGVGQSLYSYLRDTLPVKVELPKSFLALFLCFAVPMGIINYYPAGISQILSFGGVFIAIIQGVIPTLMVLSPAYQKKMGAPNARQKATAVASLIFFISVILIQGYVTFF
ncbi:MAG: GerAB/ArcD/ProY family transporter [bacterium]|nr:GerAB/ArcD/ProY family transporter [bacterium]